jgi:hypothetical protein
VRYMMLIYTKETESGLTPEQAGQLKAAHWAVMQEATRKGVLQGAEPLGPTTNATTVRVQNGKSLITDGPFAETKEQLAGYYILDCKNLDEAIEWAEDSYLVQRRRRLYRDSPVAWPAGAPGDRGYRRLVS